jgi:hypothetical protein
VLILTANWSLLPTHKAKCKEENKKKQEKERSLSHHQIQPWPSRLALAHNDTRNQLYLVRRYSYCPTRIQIIIAEAIKQVICTIDAPRHFDDCSLEKNCCLRSKLIVDFSDIF